MHKVIIVQAGNDRFIHNNCNHLIIASIDGFYFFIDLLVYDCSAPPQGFGMPPNQGQYHQPQQQQPPQAPPQQPSGTIYATQLSQASYGSNQVKSYILILTTIQRIKKKNESILYICFRLQNMAQYNQPIYVSSSSNQSLNQQQMNSAPIQNQNGPIYVSSNVANQPGMIMGYQQVNNHAPEQGKKNNTNQNIKQNLNNFRFH